MERGKALFSHLSLYYHKWPLSRFVPSSRDYVLCTKMQPSNAIHLTSYPVEIMAEIFLYAVHGATAKLLTKDIRMPRTPYALSTVCRRWRQIALSTPQMWAQCFLTLYGEDASRKMQVDIINLALERSGSCSLDVHIRTGDKDGPRTVSEEDLNFINEFLNECRGRRTFDLVGFTPGGFPPQNRQLPHLFIDGCFKDKLSSVSSLDVALYHPPKDLEALETMPHLQKLHLSLVPWESGRPLAINCPNLKEVLTNSSVILCSLLLSSVKLASASLRYDLAHTILTLDTVVHNHSLRSLHISDYWSLALEKARLDLPGLEDLSFLWLPKDNFGCITPGPCLASETMDRKMKLLASLVAQCTLRSLGISFDSPRGLTNFQLKTFRDMLTGNLSHLTKLHLAEVVSEDTQEHDLQVSYLRSNLMLLPQLLEFEYHLSDQCAQFDIYGVVSEYVGIRYRTPSEDRQQCVQLERFSMVLSSGWYEEYPEDFMNGMREMKEEGLAVYVWKEDKSYERHNVDLGNPEE